MRRGLPTRSVDFSMSAANGFNGGLNSFMQQRYTPSQPMQVPPANLGLAAMKFANGGTLPREQEHKYIPLDERKTVSEFIDGSDSSSEEITLPLIIKKKPPPKIVREFMREYIGEIKSEEQILFDQ